MPSASAIKITLFYAGSAQVSSNVRAPSADEWFKRADLLSLLLYLRNVFEQKIRVSSLVLWRLTVALRNFLLQNYKFLILKRPPDLGKQFLVRLTSHFLWNYARLRDAVVSRRINKIYIELSTAKQEKSKVCLIKRVISKLSRENNTFRFAVCTGWAIGWFLWDH